MLSCALGLTINHSTFVCTRYNDPLTTSVAGNLKNVLMTAVGVFAFGDFLYHRWNTIGICISMAGAIWYATRAALRVSHFCFSALILEFATHVKDGGVKDGAETGVNNFFCKLY